MRKCIKVLLLSLFISSQFACTNNVVNAKQNTVSSETDTAQETKTNENNKVLVVYFSVMETDGTDTVSGASRVAKDGQLFGNTEYIAKLIKKQTGGDLFQIQTEQEYPTTHAPLLEFAHNELDENARPALSSKMENLDQYSVIFLGYPTWNADFPMPLYTFLEEYNLSDKTIIPFNTHGGSGFAGTVHTIEELQPGANVIEDGISVSRTDITDSDQQVQEWVDYIQENI